MTMNNISSYLPYTESGVLEESHTYNNSPYFSYLKILYNRVCTLYIYGTGRGRYASLTYSMVSEAVKLYHNDYAHAL